MSLDNQIRIGTERYEYPKEKEQEIIEFLDKNAERTFLIKKSHDIEQIIIYATNFIWDINKDIIKALILKKLFELGAKKKEK